MSRMWMICLSKIAPQGIQARVGAIGKAAANLSYAALCLPPEVERI
jgi:hypothetical protein